MKRVNMGTTLILVCKCLSGSLIGKVPWLYPRFLIGFMFFFHDGFLNWQKTYPLKERKPNVTPWNLVVLSKRTMTWPWIKWRISQYIHSFGFVFVVFPRNEECYDICCCSCWMRFILFFKTSLLSTTQTTSYKTDVAALRATCRRLGGRHLADVWCQHLRYPHCQWRFPVDEGCTNCTEPSRHIITSHCITEHSSTLHCMQTYRWICTTIYNVVSWLVARFASVPRKTNYSAPMHCLEGSLLWQEILGCLLFVKN